MRFPFALVAALLWTGTLAAEPMIPPGREAFVLEMLGGDLPGGCVLGDVAIDRTLVRAAYDCAGAPQEITLRHPSAARPGDVLTRAFAITAASAPLGAAIAIRVRAREDGWRWTDAQANEDPRPTPGGTDDPPWALSVGARRAIVSSLLVLGALVAIGVRRLAEARAQRRAAPSG